MNEDDKSEIVKKILNTSKMTPEHLKYIYTDKTTYCCNIEQEPIFDNITPFDYIQPIKRLQSYYKDADTQYYINLYEKFKNHNFTPPIYIKDYDYDTDEILLQYVKCFKSISILIVWPVANIKNNITSTNFYKYLQENGAIHGIKEMNLSKKQAQGAIYQIYYNKSGFKDINSIKGKQAKSNADQHKNKFYIIFYSTPNQNNISGKDAPLKVQLREILRKDSGKPLDTKLNFFLHVSDTHAEKVELAQMFCNKNSMRLLQYQRLDRLFYRDLYKSLIMFMTLKNWLYQEINPLDQMRFMLFSSVVLYSLGLRDISDLDLMVLDAPPESTTTTKGFFEKFAYYLEDDKTKFPFIDGSMKGRKGWVKGGEFEYKVEWFEKTLPALYGSTSMDDTILNPKFHYYYFGVKIISIEADVKRRLERNRPAAYADLIALNMFTGEEVTFTKLPEGYWKNHVYYKFTDKEVSELYKKVVWYLRKRYGIKMELDKVKHILSGVSLTRNSLSSN